MKDLSLSFNISNEVMTTQSLNPTFERLKKSEVFGIKFP